MKVSDAYANMRSLTTKASDIARNLAFVGIGLIWLFRVNTTDGPRIDSSLRLSIVLFVLALGFDLAQYIVGGLIWRKSTRSQEEALYNQFKEEGLDASEVAERVADADIDKPANINTVTYSLFAAKLALVVIAYVPLLCFLLRET